MQNQSLTMANISFAHMFLTHQWEMEKMRFICCIYIHIYCIHINTYTFTCCVYAYVCVYILYVYIQKAFNAILSRRIWKKFIRWQLVLRHWTFSGVGKRGNGLEITGSEILFSLVSEWSNRWRKLIYKGNSTRVS